jgi:superfamily II DNA/RNA helicase
LFYSELATQIQAECEKLVPNQCVTLVGGIALVKQKRLLSTKKPSIIVATPGRLWAMVRLSQSFCNVFLLVCGLGRKTC